MSKEIQHHHPDHYNKGKIEVWDFIADQKLDFFEVTRNVLSFKKK